MTVVRKVSVLRKIRKICRFFNILSFKRFLQFIQKINKIISLVTILQVKSLEKLGIQKPRTFIWADELSDYWRGVDDQSKTFRVKDLRTNWFKANANEDAIRGNRRGRSYG